MITTIKEACEATRKIAVDHGWEEETRTFGDLIALMHSELSEALEEHRNRSAFNVIYYESGDVNYNGKPSGIPIELADCVIRIMHFCEQYGVDLTEAINLKLEYNATRPHRHGGKVI